MFMKARGVLIALLLASCDSNVVGPASSPSATATIVNTVKLHGDEAACRRVGMATEWPLDGWSWNDWMMDASFAKPQNKELHHVLAWRVFFVLNDPEAARRMQQALEICRTIGVPIFTEPSAQATADDIAACRTARFVITGQPFQSPGLRHLQAARHRASDPTLKVLLDHALLVEGGTHDDRTLKQVILRCRQLGAGSV
jgi:hypothetical protein